jgi:hypothetical protein
MSSVRSLIIDSTNVVRLKGLRDPLDTTRPIVYPTTAIVTCTLFDALGAPLTAATNLPMPYVAGTTGHSTEYRGVLPSTLPLVLGASYTLKTRAVDLAGDVRVFSKACVAVAG